MQYSHFLITLFNLKLWEADKHAAPTGTCEWLDRRCDLFERYCLPSVAAQRCGHPFTWLVMFDADTPPHVRSRIERWREVCPALTPCFFTAAEVSGFHGVSVGRQVEFINRAIVPCLTGGEQWVITTNLDNDDALAVDALGRIQHEFEREPREAVISLVNGRQYFPALRAVIAMTYPHNHFLSMAEKASPRLVTIESLSHREARRLYKVADLEGASGWLEIVHQGNVSNELRITSRIRYKTLRGAVTLRGFGIPLDFSAREQRAGNLRLLGHFFKIAVWRLRRKLFRKS